MNLLYMLTLHIILDSLRQINLQKSYNINLLICTQELTQLHFHDFFKDLLS